MAALALSPQELRLLERLRIHPAKSFPGRVRGERLTRRAGLSIEFADYRDYAEGDDLRHLDWNVLARLDAPIMKTYRDEEDLAVHILLDLSASMDFGEPSKADLARKLAGAFCIAGLNGGDAVYPMALGSAGPPPASLRGRSAFARFSAWMGNSGEAKGSSLASSLRAFASGRARVGYCVVLSDGLDPEAPAALKTLGARGHEVGMIQILSPQDARPDLEGDLRLVDAESGHAVEITASSDTLRTYHKNLQKHQAELANAVLRSGGRFEVATTDQPLEEVVQKVLVRKEWLKG
jgi:uncharacterized protein (DUF58 family)